MSVTVANLIQGPGTIYIGAFGATEPDPTTVNSVPQASAWTDLGGTMSGAEWDITQTYAPLGVDQLVEEVGARLTARQTTLTTNLAEVTLQNLAYILNDGVVASGSNNQTYVPNTSTSATQPTYHALILDGFSPNLLKRRVILRRCLSTKGTKMPYTKDKQTITPVTWDAYYVSAAIPTFQIIDQTV